MANEKFKINGVVSEVVPIVGTTGDVLKKTGSGVEWGSLTKATQTQDGLLSKEDFSKLAGIQAGAQKNNVTSTDIANWNNKVDKVSGKQLSTNDYTTVEKNKLAGIQAGAQKNAVLSVNGQTGAVTTPDTKYTAGTNVSITGTTISAKDTIYDDTALKTRITAVENRENKDTTYTAGTNVSISGTTISATDTKYGVATTSSNGLMASADKVKLNELNYTRAMTQAQYDALSTSEKNRTDVWYGIYEG